MHSCELAAPPPPAQGAALLLELGTLIIESRSSKAPSYGSKSCQAECQEAVGGASSKRSAVGSPRSSPVKRNRDQARTDEEREDGATQENVSFSHNLIDRLSLQVNKKNSFHLLKYYKIYLLKKKHGLANFCPSSVSDSKQEIIGLSLNENLKKWSHIYPDLH